MMHLYIMDQVSGYQILYMFFFSMSQLYVVYIYDLFYYVTLFVSNSSYNKKNSKNSNIMHVYHPRFFGSSMCRNISHFVKNIKISKVTALYWDILFLRTRLLRYTPSISPECGDFSY